MGTLKLVLLILVRDWTFFLLFLPDLVDGLLIAFWWVSWSSDLLASSAVVPAEVRGPHFP